MTNTDLNAVLRKLPSVEEVLASKEFVALSPLLPRDVLVEAARKQISEERKALIDARGAQLPSFDLASSAAKRALSLLVPSPRQVINATGVIIHTNLGRSVLAQEAVDAVVRVASGYSNLEYNVESMTRGSRHDHCEKLICALTGAEAAIAVNNNAAAVLMVLSEFAAGHDAIVSRGELVEIGGSFRIPDIMALSHATMVEVGTTNKTHAFDYQRAITENTAMLLKVHTSNYRMIGFTDSVSGKELRNIADRASRGRTDGSRILVYEDLGSGALLSTKALADNSEPTAGEALKQGCDLVSFSGDKLLGGPQAGIIIGSKELIDRLKSNPLARAMRLDKLTIAALEATLRIYLDPERALHEIPTLRMIEMPKNEVKVIADELADTLTHSIPGNVATIEVIPETSRAGGGSLPMYDIPTYAVKLTFANEEAQACEEFLTKRWSPSIVARIKHDSILFDVRTLTSESDRQEIVRALVAYFSESSLNGKEGTR